MDIVAYCERMVSVYDRQTIARMLEFERKHIKRAGDAPSPRLTVIARVRKDLGLNDADATALVDAVDKGEVVTEPPRYIALICNVKDGSTRWQGVGGDEPMSLRPSEVLVALRDPETGV